jgi:iron(III) transport system substrate-binding protein
MTRKITRRDILKGSSALVVGSTLFAQPVRAAGPAAEAITPALMEAAKKEGKCTFYTAMDLQFAEKLGKTFEEKHPGIKVRVERSGAERVFTRIGQEYSSNVHAVDVVNTADQSHVIVWKKNGWLAQYLPEEVVKNYDKQYYDPEGFEVVTRVLVSPFGVNTSMVKMEDAPKSFADLLDPKWKGKMVKAHPAYSGTIMNATFQIARDLGWGYLEKLAKQSILQVQSATDTPKKIALGERAIMIDGAGYLVIREKEAGKPVDVIYPTEGTPVATSPSVIFKAAPNPNAAKLFFSWMHGREGQQLLIDYARQYSANKQAVEKPGVKKLGEFKLMKEDPAGVEKGAEEIKRKYAQIFKV